MDSKTATQGTLVYSEREAREIAANWLRQEFDPESAYEMAYWRDRAGDLIGNLCLAFRYKHDSSHVGR
jgi:hypothetical protein